MVDKNDIFSGSGAEVDRYGSHFSFGSDAVAQLKRWAQTRGIGAEQDRHANHFSQFSLDAQEVKRYAQELLSKRPSGPDGPHTRNYGWFTFGHDGKKRLDNLLLTKGLGAEQDRYGAHFGIDPSTIEKAKDKVVGTAQDAKKETKSWFGK